MALSRTFPKEIQPAISRMGNGIGEKEGIGIGEKEGIRMEIRIR
jgi:hypothetical protein